jgi:eukaryotic-like serine/threonine-protein kinase
VRACAGTRWSGDAVLSSGSFFAGYRIERHLGSGGMGTVYLARHPDLPRSEALKILPAELSRDTDFRARFIQEADLAAQLDHPNIVSVYQRGEFEGQLWIAMQFVDGVNANDALRAGAMTASRAVYVIGEVAKALDYAHQRGVVHRDVKPANFLLSESAAGDDRALLGDFGIARALGHAGLTEAGTVMATLTYAAPEVLAEQRFDGRADLYSLGCSLFRLLTGQAPFTSDAGAAAVIAAHLYQPPPKVSDRAPGISPAMDAVIATAMAKNPDHRFPSARALAQAAASALHETTATGWTPPTPSGTPSAQYWHRPSPAATPTAPPAAKRRRYGITAAATVTVAAAIAAVAITTTRQQRPTPAPTAAPTTTATTPPPAIVSASALPALLLPLQQISDIVGTPDLMIRSSVSGFVDGAVGLDDQDKPCVGAFENAQPAVYAHTGSIGVRNQLLLGDNDQTVTGQAVVALPNMGVAQRLVTDQAAQWSACSGKTITFTKGQPPTQQRWTFDQAKSVDGILSITYDLAGGTEHHGCQRAMAVRKNVVIDTETCSPHLSNQAVDILNAIATKPPLTDR